MKPMSPTVPLISQSLSIPTTCRNSSTGSDYSTNGNAPCSQEAACLLKDA